MLKRFLFNVCKKKVFPCDERGRAFCSFRHPLAYAHTRTHQRVFLVNILHSVTPYRKAYDYQDISTCIKIEFTYTLPSLLPALDRRRAMKENKLLPLMITTGP